LNTFFLLAREATELTDLGIAFHFSDTGVPALPKAWMPCIPVNNNLF